jgi:hypothetical protein
MFMFVTRTLDIVQTALGSQGLHYYIVITSGLQFRRVIRSDKFSKVENFGNAAAFLHMNM